MMDLKRPVEIAPETFWIGSYIEGDIFQCNNYLIRDGKECVLVDPGSAITFEESFKKLKYLTDPANIKYIICHHQDPDITGSLPMLIEALPKGERYIITHWRTYFLLKHLNLHLPFYLVDQHDYRLTLESGRTLKFILTPYMHYPGNIVTFDESTGVLFSSDIFGGWMESWQLFADESYPEKMRPFHEVYMPSKEIVLFTLSRLKKLPIKVIAPQHGSIIKDKKIIEAAFRALEEFNYGILLESPSFEEVKRLEVKRSIVKKVELFSRDKLCLSEVVPFAVNAIRTMLPVVEIGVWISQKHTEATYSSSGGYNVPLGSKKHQHRFRFSDGDTKATVSITLSREPRDKWEKELMEEVASIIFYTAKRDIHIRSLEASAFRYRKMALTDSLTGLYRKEAVESIAAKEVKKAKLQGKPLSCLMLDIDNFKAVNDTKGHLTGDMLLKEVGKAIRECLRKNDIPIRYGGDEFLIFLPGSGLEAALKVAERLKASVEQVEVDGAKVKVSIGVTELKKEESIHDLVRRCDMALYRAKRLGKNRIEALLT